MSGPHTPLTPPTPPTPPTKVLVAMSGGVDSSVAAALLLREGFEVVGCFMRLGSSEETGPETKHHGCCSLNDAADARRVAAKLGIPLYICNFKKEFGRVIDYFVAEYNAGRTPNPCIRCNDWLKFGKLHSYARQMGARFVASGHYARIDTGPGAPRLLRGVDRDKDQSYVLFGTPPERLREMLLPIGGYHKVDVRRIARRLDLPVFDKPDSQEICFVDDNDYAGLVGRHTKMVAGSIVDTSGKVLGRHRGHQHFTVGQRRGLGVAMGYPLYVVQKDAATNTVCVGGRAELLAEGCAASGANWLRDPDDGRWITCTIKIRYNAQPVEGRVRATAQDRLEVCFAQSQFAVALGQAVVCYDGDQVICGGWISETQLAGGDRFVTGCPQSKSVERRSGGGVLDSPRRCGVDDNAPEG